MSFNFARSVTKIQIFEIGKLLDLGNPKYLEDLRGILARAVTYPCFDGMHHYRKLAEALDLEFELPDNGEPLRKLAFGLDDDLYLFRIPHSTDSRESLDYLNATLTHYNFLSRYL